MKAMLFKAVASKSDRRVSYTAYNDDMLISFTVVDKEGGAL
jgi:hypothetical protein